nr:MAG TPA: hypothetical protein [Caudoviricetes sp.]
MCLCIITKFLNTNILVFNIIIYNHDEVSPHDYTLNSNR